MGTTRIPLTGVLQSLMPIPLPVTEGGLVCIPAVFLSKGTIAKPIRKVMNRIRIDFDGGCRPYNPGHKYGSYQILLNGELLDRVDRMELGWGTNNEAEFQMLIEAVAFAGDRIDCMGMSRKDCFLSLHTDATIVVNRINGSNMTNKSEPQQRMFKLAAQAREIINTFGGFEIEWHRRDANVALFGH